MFPSLSTDVEVSLALVSRTNVASVAKTVLPTILVSRNWENTAAGVWQLEKYSMFGPSGQLNTGSSDGLSIFFQ